jgi:hypothetical protein
VKASPPSEVAAQLASTPSLTMADTPTDEDLLGFERFAEPLAERIAAVKIASTPLTIGVYGEWGSGKTSFLKMVDRHLRDRVIYPIWFNAWKYNKEDDLWSALIQTILDQVRVVGPRYRRPWVKARIWLDSFDLWSGSWELTRKLAALVFRLLLLALALLLVVSVTARGKLDPASKFLSTVLSSHPDLLQFLQLPVTKTVVALIALIGAKPESLLKIFDIKLGIDLLQVQSKADL